MAQISLYVNDVDYKRIEASAKKAGKSISGWVVSMVIPQIKDSYTEEFLELYGSIDEEDLQRPQQIGFSADSKREAL